MRIKTRSPPLLLAVIGLILVLYVIGAGRSSAMLGGLLVIGVLMIIISAVWAFIRSRR